MKVAGAGAVLAAAQERGRAQAGGARIAMALVGCAHIHVPPFVKLLKGRPDVAVKWVWDHDAARAETRAGELGARVAKSAEEVWKDGDVRAAVVASETDRHRDLVMAGAKAGKHMFVEKPLGVSASESREMAGTIEKAGVLFTTGYFMRTHPEHLFLKGQVAAGAFGTITRAEAWNCHAGAIKGWFDTDWRWMADPQGRRRRRLRGSGDPFARHPDVAAWRHRVGGRGYSRGGEEISRLRRDRPGADQIQVRGERRAHGRVGGCGQPRESHDCGNRRTCRRRERAAILQVRSGKGRRRQDALDAASCEAAAAAGSIRRCGRRRQGQAPGPCA